MALPTPHGTKEPERPCSSNEIPYAGVVARDKLAHDVYQSVLRTRRCDWIELMNCAPMASQYHLSAYSVLKFGVSGAPYAYLPLTLQQPRLAETVLERQRKNETHAWRVKLHLNAGLGLKDSSNAIHLVDKLTDGTNERIYQDLQVAMADKSQAESQDSACVIKTSNSHPISLSPIIPVHLLPYISADVLSHLPPCFKMPETHDKSQDPVHISLKTTVRREDLDVYLEKSLQDTEGYALGQIRGEHLVRMPRSVPLDSMLNENGAPLEQFSSHSPTSEGPLIGNLLLSSCPGKKVRLDEPFQGRSPICRDLKIDLDRIRQMGVRAIVCCLDDEELNMLGAPCHEYREQAQSQGFDLICLPMAEGFAPINMTRLDMIMSMLILNYTLRGTSILVHCRGGVGRAGLVACIWLLKMNLVSLGSEDTPKLCPCSNTSSQVLDTVLKLIDTVRKRRSLRAIETAEQARFLMEYVRFIFGQERARFCLKTAMP